ncbi:DUF1847 domain-containing protein [Clostridium oceanicum]|uniref:Metal-binding protein n=1 Tax=Clostridium oceanicum TaxID=1543 RepID=A0ABP3UI57_9CLOT
MDSYIGLYNRDDLNTMKLAQTCKSTGASRIEEIKRFAIQAGYKKIGIAYCVSVSKYAELLEDYLKDTFEVIKIDCRCGKIPSSEFVSGGKGLSCNPAGQAKILEENDTDFNIVMGLCLGHDIIFNNKSKAPTTTLFVKDRTNNHNTIEGFNNL